MAYHKVNLFEPEGVRKAQFHKFGGRKDFILYYHGDEYATFWSSDEQREFFSRGNGQIAGEIAKLSIIFHSMFACHRVQFMTFVRPHRYVRTT